MQTGAGKSVKHLGVSAKSRLVASLLIGITCLGSACCVHQHPKPQNEKETVQVSGEVFVDGQPGWGVRITLHRKDGVNVKNPTTSVGDVGEDGLFMIRTYDVDDGAPPGKYVLTFFQVDRTKIPDLRREPTDQLKGRYKDWSKSKHFVSVPEGGDPVILDRIELSTTSEQVNCWWNATKIWTSLASILRITTCSAQALDAECSKPFSTHHRIWFTQV